MNLGAGQPASLPYGVEPQRWYSYHSMQFSSPLQQSNLPFSSVCYHPPPPGNYPPPLHLTQPNHYPPPHHFTPPNPYPPLLHFAEPNSYPPPPTPNPYSAYAYHPHQPSYPHTQPHFIPTNQVVPPHITHEPPAPIADLMHVEPDPPLPRLDEFMESMSRLLDDCISKCFKGMRVSEDSSPSLRDHVPVPTQMPKSQSSEPRNCSPLRQQPNTKPSPRLGDAQSLMFSTSRIEQAFGGAISATGRVKKRRYWKRNKLLMRNISLFQSSDVPSLLGNSISAQSSINTASDCPVSGIDFRVPNLNFVNHGCGSTVIIPGAKLSGVNVNCDYEKRSSGMNVEMDGGNGKGLGELEGISGKQGEMQGPYSCECHALKVFDKTSKSDGFCGSRIAALTSIRDKGGGLAHRPLEHATGVNSKEEDEGAVQLCAREFCKLMLADNKREFSSKKYKVAYDTTLKETLCDTFEGTQALVDNGKMTKLFRSLREPRIAYIKVYSSNTNLGFEEVDVVETILKSCWEESCLMIDVIIHDSSGIMKLGLTSSTWSLDELEGNLCIVYKSIGENIEMIEHSNEELQYATLVNLGELCCLHKHDKLSNEISEYDALQLSYKKLQLEDLVNDRREGDARFGWLLESVIIPTGDKNSVDYFLEVLQSIPYSYQDWRASFNWFLAAMIQCGINPIVCVDNVLLGDMDESVSLHFVNDMEMKANIVEKCLRVAISSLHFCMSSVNLILLGFTYDWHLEDIIGSIRRSTQKLFGEVNSDHCLTNSNVDATTMKNANVCKELDDSFAEVLLVSNVLLADSNDLHPLRYAIAKNVSGAIKITDVTGSVFDSCLIPIDQGAKVSDGLDNLLAIVPSGSSIVLLTKDICSDVSMDLVALKHVQAGLRTIFIIVVEHPSEWLSKPLVFKTALSTCRYEDVNSTSQSYVSRSDHAAVFLLLNVSERLQWFSKIIMHNEITSASFLCVLVTNWSRAQGYQTIAGATALKLCLPYVSVVQSSNYWALVYANLLSIICLIKHQTAQLVMIKRLLDKRKQLDEKANVDSREFSDEQLVGTIGWVTVASFSCGLMFVLGNFYEDILQNFETAANFSNVLVVDDSCVSDLPFGVDISNTLIFGTKKSVVELLSIVITVGPRVIVSWEVPLPKSSGNLSGCTPQEVLMITFSDKQACRWLLDLQFSRMVLSIYMCGFFQILIAKVATFAASLCFGLDNCSYQNNYMIAYRNARELVWPGYAVELMKFDTGSTAAILGASKAFVQLKPSGPEFHFIAGGSKKYGKWNSYEAWGCLSCRIPEWYFSYVVLLCWHTMSPTIEVEDKLHNVTFDLNMKLEVKFCLRGMDCYDSRVT